MNKTSSKLELPTLIDDWKVFKGKRVLITGHSGFKGSWLSLILHDIGAEVFGFSLPAEEDLNHANLIGLNNLISNQIGDIRDKKLLNSVFEEFKPEFVFHLAAQSLVKRSYGDPIDTFETNILGSANVLEEVRKATNVKSLVYVTSDKCYENVEWVWGYRESDPLGGVDPYSSSKAAAELIFSSYQRSYFENLPHLGAASARAGNVIGGGDWSKDRIIPDCIKSITKDESVILRNPESTRPWQHVLEPVSGYLTLASALYTDPKKFSSSWNFGPDVANSKTVVEVTRELFKQIGKGKLEIEIEAFGLHEATLLQLNCEKAKKYLNWAPKWSTEEAISATAQWYKAYFEGAVMSEVSRKQIADYFGVAS